VDEAPDESCTDIGWSAIFKGEAMYPEYLNDAHVLVCPSDSDGADRWEKGRWNFGSDPNAGINPCRIDDLSYLYFGWATRKEDYLIDPADDNKTPSALGDNISTNYALAAFIGTGLLAQIDAAPTVAEAGRLADEPMEFTHETRGDVVIYRLREGIERFMITDINNAASAAEAQSSIAVMFDEVSTEAKHFSHVPGGANTLYMDGHVVFLKYPSEYPASVSWATIVGL
jgi:prepilin-type processing-associated H-X9-DG protein